MGSDLVSRVVFRLRTADRARGPKWEGGARRASSGDGELRLELGQRPGHFRQSLDLGTERRLVALLDANAVDAHHAHAKAAGAVIAMPLEDTDYASRQYSVWDDDHRLWCFGTYNHAPFGEPTLFLVLRYPDRPATARRLAQAFGFEPALTSSGSCRSAECTELRLGDSALWLSSAAPDDLLWSKDWHAGSSR